MTPDQDYLQLARSLVQAHGDDALKYARRYAMAEPDRPRDTAQAWVQVASAVERLIAQKDRRRRIGDSASR